jgi:hypothetical protein
MGKWGNFGFYMFLGLPGLVWVGLTWACLGRPGLAWAGLGRIGLAWSCLGWPWLKSQQLNLIFMLLGLQVQTWSGLAWACLGWSWTAWAGLILPGLAMIEISTAQPYFYAPWITSSNLINKVYRIIRKIMGNQNKTSMVIKTKQAWVCKIKQTSWLFSRYMNL